MVVYPVAAPGDAHGLVQLQVWIPPGQWIEWFSGLAFTGPAVVTRQFALDDIPVYVKAGAIVPLEAPEDRASLIGGSKELPSTLTFAVFASKAATHGETNVYEDDGNSTNYQNDGNFAWTKATYSLSGDAKQINVTVWSDTSSILPKQRKFRIVIHGVYPPTEVRINNNLHDWKYDGDKLALVVESGAVPTASGVAVTAKFANALDATLVSGLPLAFRRTAFVKSLFDQQWAAVYQEDYQAVILSASTGQRLSFNASSAVAEISRFNTLYSTAINQVTTIPNLAPAVRAQALALLNAAKPHYMNNNGDMENVVNHSNVVVPII